MSENIEYTGDRDRKTVFTDCDGDTAEIERTSGAPVDPDEYIYVHTSTYGAYVPVKELIEAIEKAAGISRPVAGETVINVTAEPLWDEVEYRPARAVKVTPELVRNLAEGGPEELSELEPRFFSKTGKPKGVEILDPITFRAALVEVGHVVVLRPGQPPIALSEDEFEKTYRKASA